MLEAFERHLRTHNISKQFEEAKTKEDKIAVCKKFLEDEGYYIINGAEAQMKEREKIYDSYPGVLAVGGAGGGGAGGFPNPMGKITIGDMNYDPMTLAIDPSTMGSITVSSMDTFQPAKNQPLYVKAHYRLTRNSQDTLTQDQITYHITHELEVQLEKGLRQFINDKKLIKEETDYSTLDKLYSIKIGFVE